MSAKKGVDAATPTLTESTRTTEDKVAATHIHYNAAKASSDWVTLPPDLQASFAAWAQIADNMGTNKASIEDLLKQVSSLRVAEKVLLGSWLAQKQVCLGGVRQTCAGSKTRVKNLGFAVAGKGVRPLAPAATDLKGKRVKVLGTAMVEWACDAYKHTYQVQYATDVATPATYSAPITVTKRSFQLLGQTPGATLHFRVLVLDPKLPTGQTDWTPWVAVIVS